MSGRQAPGRKVAIARLTSFLPQLAPPSDGGKEGIPTALRRRLRLPLIRLDGLLLLAALLHRSLSKRAWLLLPLIHSWRRRD